MIQKAGTALASEIPMADQTSATCCGHDASIQPISCSHWLLLHGLGSVGLLALSDQFDFPRDNLERAILHDLPHFSGRSSFPPQTQDGHRLAHTATFSSEGLAGALDSLLATCPPAKPTAPLAAVPFMVAPFTAATSKIPLQTIGARDGAAK